MITLQLHSDLTNTIFAHQGTMSVVWSFQIFQISDEQRRVVLFQTQQCLFNLC